MYNFPKNFYSDVRVECIYRSHIRIEMGRLEEIKEAKDSGAFIRLFDGKKWYYSSTTDLNSIDKELENLASLATPNPEINQHPTIVRLQKNQGDCCRFAKNSVQNIPLPDKLNLTKSYAKIVEKDEEINLWSVNYSDSNITKEFSSSIGCNVKFDTQIAGIRMMFKFGSGANGFSETWYKACVTYEELRGLEKLAKAHVEKARNFYKNAETVQGGNYTVVLSPMAAGVFAHESFGHKSEADFMVGDEEMIKEWQLGKHVGSPALSIIDDGNVIGSGYTPYDDEGNKACKTTLIEKGILSGRLHSVETAAALNESATGNARAMNFEYEPIVRMTCTYIDSDRKMTKEELIGGVKYGILVDTIKHGSGMSTFTIAPSMAFLIEDGKVTKPVKFSVISGNVMKTLDQIDAVSDELVLLSFVGGGCGKMEQYPLPVGFGGPYVRVKEINVQ